MCRKDVYAVRGRAAPSRGAECSGGGSDVKTSEGVAATRKISAHEAEARLLADPRGRVDVFAAGFLEMVEVLLEGLLVELREELGADGGVDLADAVDELTFVHGVLLF